MKQLSLIIHGHVQGINFRWDTKKQARDLGLVGFVKNAPDGTVQIVAQGEEDALTKLQKWCKNGPDFAKVTRVEEEWEDISVATFNVFEIVY